MNNERTSLHFQIIRQLIPKFQHIDAETWQALDAALEDLQVSCEEMQTSLEASEVTNQALLHQNQQIATNYSHYHDLFQSSPIAYLVTDANGVILEANQAVAHLLNVPQPYVVGKPLAVFIAENELQTFYAKLNQLASTTGVQHWQLSLRPWRGQPFTAHLHIAFALPAAGSIKTLRVAVYNVDQFRQESALPAVLQTVNASQTPEGIPMSQLPQSLDGLRVLVVDDEADIREFITVVLESHGIGVRAVASAAIALEELERFQPNVLLSDIRMPGGDGYSLIQQIRALEAQQGGHLPAAAITAYLEEDREKSRQAGFEAHLNKLAKPTEWVAMVTQLAAQATDLNT